MSSDFFLLCSGSPAGFMPSGQHSLSGDLLSSCRHSPCSEGTHRPESRACCGWLKTVTEVSAGRAEQQKSCSGTLGPTEGCTDPANMWDLCPVKENPECESFNRTRLWGCKKKSPQNKKTSCP